MQEKGVFDLKTLSSIIKGYLKGRKDHTERWLLRQFNQFMDKSHSSIMVKDVKHEHFDSFLKTLTGSQASLKSYASRLNRFKAYIGLSERKVKENPEPTTKKARQLERKLAENEEALTLHRKTIDTKDAEIKKLHGIIDTFNLKGIELEKLRNLETTFEARKADLEKEHVEKKAEKEAELAELDKKFAENKKIMERQAIVKLICPKKGFVVSFGNDCQECDDFASCAPYTQLVNPEEEEEKEQAEEEDYE